MSREGVERMTRRLIESARQSGKEVRTRDAEKLARDSMTRAERDNRDRPGSVFHKYRDGER